MSHPDGITTEVTMSDDELQPALGTWEAIDSLRVVREFDPRPLAPWIVERILDAGRRTGSSKNRQRWVFVVCRDREHLAQLSTLGPWAGHLAGAAVAIALLMPDPGKTDAPLSLAWDLGRAAQSMVLAAWELGIGSVPATVYEHDRARELLGYPPDWHCEFILSFGHPADPGLLTAPKRAGGRKRLAEIVHEERW
jgi:nitroreductase